MSATKLSISLPQELMNFIDYYRMSHKTHNRSDVIKDALDSLRERELEAAYAAANQEIDLDFDNCTADGLDDRTW